MRPGIPAPGAAVERRRVTGHRQRAQQVGVQDGAGNPLLGRHRPEPTNEQQELLDRGFLLLGHQAVRGLQHDHAGGVALVVQAQPGMERRQRLGLGDHVEAPPLGQLQVDMGERFESRSPA
jgi:hypothetical protein